MPVGAPTNVSETSSGGAGTDVVSDSLNIVTGDLLYFACFYGHTSSIDFDAFTASFATTVIAVIDKAVHTTGLNLGVAVGYCVADETTSTGTITGSTLANTSLRVMEVKKIGSGAKLTAPTNFDTFLDTTTAAPSKSYPSVPTAGALLLNWLGWYNAGMQASNAPDSAGYTELTDAVFSGAVNISIASAHADGSEGQTFGWDITPSGGTITLQALAAVEIEEDAGLSAAIGLVSTTEAAQPLEGGVAAEIGLVTQSNNAQSFAAGLVGDLGLVTESNLAQLLTTALASLIGLVSETNEARAVSGSGASSGSIGLVDQLNQAQSLAGSGSKSDPIGLVVQPNQAQALASGIAAAVGFATEQNESRPVAGAGAAASPIGLVAEQDSAFAVSGEIAGPIGYAEEFTESATIPGLVAKSVGIAQEFGIALPTGNVLAGTLGQAQESAAAQSVSSAVNSDIGRAEESSLARSVGSGAVVPIGRVEQVNEALTLLGGVANPVGIAVELSAALSFDNSLGSAIGLAEEANAALMLGTPGETLLGADPGLGLASKTRSISVRSPQWSIRRHL